MKYLSTVALAATFLIQSAAPQNVVNNSITRSPATLFRGALDATQFPGADGCAKINAAIAALPATGGMIDATGFTSPQVVATTCVTSTSPTGNQVVEIDFNPSTQWVPATPGMSVISVNPKSLVRGLSVDASEVPGYSGNAVAFEQNNDPDLDYTLLEDTQINLPHASGVGIFISPASNISGGYSGLNIRGLRVHQGLIAINMVSGPGVMQYLNSNNFSDFWVKDAVTCINMDGSAQVTAETWLSAMAGNHFVNGACQVGPDTQYALVLKNSSDNSFSNVGTWDGGTSTGDATSDFNYWNGFGSMLVENWLGLSNNYQDAHGDSISPTGMHQFNYEGGVNFVGPKAQFSYGPVAIQWLPTSYDGLPALQVAGGGAIGTLIGPTKTNTSEVDQNGSPLQVSTGAGSTTGSGSGADSLQSTADGLQVVGGGYSNVYLEGKSIDFTNGSTEWKLQEDPDGIRVVRLGCCDQSLLDGNKISTAEYDLTDGTTSKMLLSVVPPLIASGFGLYPSITQSNGPSSFTIRIGREGNAVSGIVNLQTAPNGWNCWCNDLTTTSRTVFMCKQTASTPSSVTLGNFNNVGDPALWSQSDTIAVSCFAH